MSVSNKEHIYTYRFKLAYANVPMSLRREICTVIDGEPMTWRVANLEVTNNTDIGYKIIEQMKRLDLI